MSGLSYTVTPKGRSGFRGSPMPAADSSSVELFHINAARGLRHGGLRPAGLPATIGDVENGNQRADSVWADLERIRAEAPLVHNITNYVVMNVTANALLALGASPVMAHAEEEVAEMTAIARALVINIGTLSTPWVAAMFKAGGVARRNGLAIVLDPVGAGATAFRTGTARGLLEELSPAIVRGNPSEIRALASDERATHGVDSAHAPEDAASAALAVACRSHGAVVASGPTDLILCGTGVARVGNGHPMMARVTGMGCTASALAGAFAAVNPSPYDAAVNAMVAMGIAGELAAEGAPGPGSFLPRFLDALYLLSEADIRGRIRVHES